MDKKRERGLHLGWLTGGEMEKVHSSMTRVFPSPATTHCDEDRSCQWIHSAGISSRNLRKLTEATADPQLLELNPKNCHKSNTGGRERGGIDVGNEGKV